MNNIIPFGYNNHNVRTMTDDNGEIWFVAKDVAEILGYTDAKQAIRMHCKASVLAKECQINTLHPQTKLIPERDLYRLIMKSKLPAAEAFEEWVVGEVLPTIRKTGGTYMTDDALQRTLDDPDYMIGVLTTLKTVKAERDNAVVARDLAVATKAHISRTREASAMGTASAAKKQQQVAEREAKRLRVSVLSPRTCVTCWRLRTLPTL